MQKAILFLILIHSICTISCQNDMKKDSQPINDTTKVIKTEAEWKKKLTPNQYFILREKGTEKPGTGEFLFHKEKGFYTCAGCGERLFSDEMKFESHCGWPSFDREIEGGKIKQIVDQSHGMTRTEIVCAKCGGHLGHIFDDGPTATGQRYCVNGGALGFEPKK